jgi:CheY-like chemotaxis protein
VDWKSCFQGKKVLVAEDDEINRDLMTDILGLMHCAFEFACDGAEAVEKFQKGSYELILMDIRMPKKDGITATKEIRALEQGKTRIPIVALTASLLEEDKRNCIAAGVDDFVAKPIHLEELRQKMAKYLLGAA